MSDGLSAFGIDHGLVSKAGQDGRHKYSTGRAVTATNFGAIHSAIAGKKGKKASSTARSAGYTIGGSTAGQVAGMVAGAKLGGQKGAAVGGGLGSATGSFGGAYGAFRVNNKKGNYKPQKKK